MKKDNIEFRDALRVLAERAGVALESRRDPQEDARRSRLFDLNEAAAAFFQRTLLTRTAVSRRKRRSRATTSPSAAWRRVRSRVPDRLRAEQLGRAVRATSVGAASTQKRCRDAGLAVEGDRGAYDRFRHRLMFPIRDDRGRIAGFGGRMLPGDALGAGECTAEVRQHVAVGDLR